MTIRISFSLLFCFSTLLFIAQPGSTATTRNVIWFIPSKAARINGIAIGPVISTNTKGKKFQTFNGLTLELGGFGIFLGPGLGENPYLKYLDKKKTTDKEVRDKLLAADTANFSVIHNGVLFSGGGSLTEEVNGFALFGFSGIIQRLNGVAIVPFFLLSGSINGVVISSINLSAHVRGVQIGLFNQAVELQGVQIGLWNRTRTRGLPFINIG